MELLKRILHWIHWSCELTLSVCHSTKWLKTAWNTAGSLWDQLASKIVCIDIFSTWRQKKMCLCSIWQYFPASPAWKPSEDLIAVLLLDIVPSVDPFDSLSIWRVLKFPSLLIGRPSRSQCQWCPSCAKKASHILPAEGPALLCAAPYVLAAAQPCVQQAAPMQEP